MCTLLSVRKTRTTPYHPQSDAQVERFNCTLTSMLSNYVAENHRDWDIHLSKVLMAYRSSEHETTKCTPYYLMFGREVRLRVDIMFGCCPEEPAETTEYMVHLRNALEQAHEKVRQHVKSLASSMLLGTGYGSMCQLSRRDRCPSFQLLGMARMKSLRRYQTSHNRLRKEGPGGKIRVEHFNRLKPWKTPPNRIADQDQPHVHHPPINEDPLNNEPIVTRGMRQTCCTSS